MYVAFLAPHDPRIMPKRFLAMYDPEQVELPPNFMANHPFDNGELNIRDELLAEAPRQASEIRSHIAEYYAMITHLDDEMGRVLAALDARGLTDNTIIVFAGDNGLAVGQHGLMGKQNLYDHSVRVPLILAGPGIPEGDRTAALCYLLDLFPTLCDLTGLPTPESVEGRSLAPVIEDPTRAGRELLHFAYKGYQRAVRKDDLKLIEYHVNGHRRRQLFDLTDDPLEMNDLSARPDQAERLADLRAELDRWRTELGDTQAFGREFWGQ